MASWVRDWLWYLDGVAYGTARSSDGWGMAFDAVDVCWLSRALTRETGGALSVKTDAVSAVLIQRCYLLRRQNIRRRDGRIMRPPHSLGDMALAYSAAINPGLRHQGPPDIQRKRQRAATMPPWTVEAEHPGLIERVVRLLRGGISLEPYTGLVHFAECDFGEARMGSPDVQIGGECFWYSGDSRYWERGRVRIAPPAGVRLSGLAIPVGLQAAAVAAVVAGPEWGLLSAIPFVPP